MERETYLRMLADARQRVSMFPDWKRQENERHEAELRERELFWERIRPRVELLADPA
jgi:hypothetical protein